MPLTFEHIQGRADFQRLLDTLLVKARALLPAKPGDWPAIESIAMQLDAIRRWTDRGRDPLPEERASVTIGRIVVRELEPAPSPEMAETNQQLMELTDYLKRWPSDDALATSDDDDLLSDFYD